MLHGREISCSRLSGLFAGGSCSPGHYEFRARRRNRLNGKERKSHVTDNDRAKMKTDKSVMQGYTAIAVTDGKHQVIAEAQAHGAPQEQELLQTVLSGLQERFQDLGLSGNVLAEAKLTADSVFHGGTYTSIGSKHRDVMAMSPTTAFACLIRALRMPTGPQHPSPSQHASDPAISTSVRSH